MKYQLVDSFCLLLLTAAVAASLQGWESAWFLLVPMQLLRLHVWWSLRELKLPNGLTQKYQRANRQLCACFGLVISPIFRSAAHRWEQDQHCAQSRNLGELVDKYFDWTSLLLVGVLLMLLSGMEVGGSYQPVPKWVAHVMKLLLQGCVLMMLRIAIFKLMYSLPRLRMS